MDLPTGLPQRQLQSQDEDSDNAGLFESNLLYQMISVVGWFLLTFSVLFCVWVSEPCISRITARWKAPPKCVLEIGNVKTLLSRMQKLLKRFIASASNKDGGSYDDVIVLPNECREHFVELQLAFKDAVAGKSPLTPVIFHGPNGTGKFSAAKQIARNTAIPYALVSGAALVESSFQLDALVSWANAFSRGNGILIYIDQADVFLSKDSREKLINKFTDVLDGVRRDIFFIIATRDVENIDRGVLDRCEQLQFSLPDGECRRELLLSYFDEHVRSFIDANNECAASSLLSRLIRTLTLRKQRLLSIDYGVMTGEALENSVAGTRGLSARDIQELSSKMQTKLHQSKDGRLTHLDVWEAIEEAQTKLRQTEHSISITNLHSDVDFYEVTVV